MPRAGIHCQVVENQAWSRPSGYGSAKSIKRSFALPVPKYVGQERDDISWVLPPFEPLARAPTGNQQDALQWTSTSALLHFAVAQVTEAAENAIDMGTAPALGSIPLLFPLEYIG